MTHRLARYIAGYEPNGLEQHFDFKFDFKWVLTNFFARARRTLKLNLLHVQDTL